MDKYDQQLEFLIQALPHQTKETCQTVFLSVAKRDLRKALFYLLQPDTELEEVLAFLRHNTSDIPAQQMEWVDRLMHWYCPNTSYKKIVKQAAKGIPVLLDGTTISRLKTFRRPPRKEMFQQWFQLMDNRSDVVVLYFIKCLRSFDRELEPFWGYIDGYARSSNLDIAKAALVLLAQMPTGIQKSVITIGGYLKSPQMRFHALIAMQNATRLSTPLLSNLLNPIITEYRQLVNRQGRMNDLWEEYRLIQVILKNNGVSLSIPDIGLGRF
jgi:hypothetical protein